MLKINMLSLSTIQKPINQWNNNYISPGPVSTVGVPQVNCELKKSAPFLPIRWGIKEDEYLGTYVTDGMYGGLPADVCDLQWCNPQPRKRPWGLEIISLSKPDTTREPFVSSTYHYNYANKKANVYNSLSSGKGFVPPPGPFDLPMGATPRGGNFPRVIAQEDGTNSATTDPMNTHQNNLRNISRLGAQIGSVETGPKLPSRLGRN
jgi:hypothetical protein